MHQEMCATRCDIPRQHTYADQWIDRLLVRRRARVLLCLTGPHVKFKCRGGVARVHAGLLNERVLVGEQ